MQHDLKWWTHPEWSIFSFICSKIFMGVFSPVKSQVFKLPDINPIKK